MLGRSQRASCGAARSSTARHSMVYMPAGTCGAVSSCQAPARRGWPGMQAGPAGPARAPPPLHPLARLWCPPPALPTPARAPATASNRPAPTPRRPHPMGPTPRQGGAPGLDTSVAMPTAGHKRHWRPHGVAATPRLRVAARRALHQPLAARTPGLRLDHSGSIQLGVAAAAVDGRSVPAAGRRGQQALEQCTAPYCCRARPRGCAAGGRSGSCGGRGRGGGGGGGGSQVKLTRRLVKQWRMPRPLQTTFSGA